MVDKPTYNWGHHLVKPEVPKAILRFQMFIQFGSSTKFEHVHAQCSFAASRTSKRACPYLDRHSSPWLLPAA